MTNKTLFCSFYANFCALCASLRLKRTVFSWLLKKAISMALWTKATLCVKSSLLEQSLPRTPSRLKTSIISVNPVILSNLSSCLGVLVAINPFNQRKLRLIKDLRLFNALYNCKETLTDVMSALQIKLFLQNKAKFQKSQMNVNKVLTKAYDKMDTWLIGKKQSQTNPNKAKSKKAKMNVTSYITKGYENKSPIRAPKKQTQFKPNLSRRSLWRSRNKPNRTQCLSAISVADQKQKNVFGYHKILTITNMDANLKKCTVFHLFIERTLFGR